MPNTYEIKDGKLILLPDSTDAWEGHEYHGNLDLSYQNVTELPDPLYVHGTLNLTGCPIAKLPEALSVDGDLNISFTKITSLAGEFLSVLALYAQHTGITEIPASLLVGSGGIDVADSKVKKVPENWTVYGDLVMTNCPIEYFPEDMSVMGDCVLMGVKAKRLPEWLNVSGNLYLQGSKIKELPEHIQVGGSIFFKNRTQMVPFMDK